MVDSERQIQTRIGLFTLIVLAAVAAVVLFLTREGGLFTATYVLHADFDNIQGLTESAPVRLAGNNVGRVRSIYFLGPNAPVAIRVELEVDAGVRDRVRKDSKAMIQTIGLLGDKFVALSLGSPDSEPLEGAGPLDTVEPINFEEVAEEGRRLVGHLTGLARSSENVVGHFEAEMGGRSLAATLGAVQRLVAEIERGNGLLHKLVYAEEGPGTLDELDDMVGQVRSILGEIQNGRGTLHELIYPPEDEAASLTAIADAARSLDRILRKVDEGEGTLGALVNDPSLYEETRLLVGGARRSVLLRTLIDYVRPEDSE
jgi:phospholipid/cholesterol/gamma-HCH transport system substrate-binding protein